MNLPAIGLLHPGEMGISVAATIQNTGHAVYWASDGRSPQTHARAERHGLRDAGTPAGLCATCSTIVSVCPPDAAEAVAADVLARGFRGLYLDANAISPQRARRMAGAFADAGATFVDGGIIGGPAWQPDSTWLYLSGPAADTVAGYFVPAVILLAIATFLAWYLWGAAVYYPMESRLGISLIFMASVLLISCPCALGFRRWRWALRSASTWG